jgi:hypothetical protein
VPGARGVRGPSCKALGGECLHRPIVTRARVPRQVVQKKAVYRGPSGWMLFSEAGLARGNNAIPHCHCQSLTAVA